MIFTNFCCFSAFGKVATFYTSTSERIRYSFFSFFTSIGGSGLKFFSSGYERDSVTRFFGTSLFHESKPSLINRLKWFCWKFVFEEIFAKNLFWRKLTLRKAGLCAGKHCSESNTFFRFSKISISKELRIHMVIFRKNFENFQKSKIS